MYLYEKSVTDLILREEAAPWGIMEIDEVSSDGYDRYRVHY